MFGFESNIFMRVNGITHLKCKGQYGSQTLCFVTISWLHQLIKLIIIRLVHKYDSSQSDVRLLQGPIFLDLLIAHL